MGHIWASYYLLYVPYPVLDIFKRLLVGDVVDKHDALKKKKNSKSNVLSIKATLCSFKEEKGYVAFVWKNKTTPTIAPL